MDAKVNAATQAVLEMTIYLHQALRESGSSNPKQEILDTVVAHLGGKIFSLPDSGLAPKQILLNMIVLVDAMLSGEIRREDLVLIRKNLDQLMGLIVEA